MGYVRWGIAVVFWGLIGLVLLYTLPRHDEVRIVSTEVRRIDFGSNSIFWSNSGSGGASGQATRDVYFVSAFRPNGRARVYRNEDTGWIWPPYFKLNSSNLHAKVQDLVSTSDDPNWVRIRFYGWRFEPLSIYPNAVKVWKIDDTEARYINWFNIVFLALFGAFIWAIWRRIERFREKRIDPVIEDITDGFEAASERMESRRGRLRRWLKNWKQT